MALLSLGNDWPLHPDGSPADIGPQVTTVEFPYGPEDRADDVAALAGNAEHKYRVAGLTDEWRPYYCHLLDVEDLWKSHGDAAPTWVSGDDPALVALIADRYGCEVREA